MIDASGLYIYDNNAQEKIVASISGATNFFTSTNYVFIVLNNKEFLVRTS